MRIHFGGGGGTGEKDIVFAILCGVGCWVFFCFF